MKIKGIIETCLYARNLDEAEHFYNKLPGLEGMTKEDGRHLFYRCGKSMLLIFNPDHTINNQTDVDGQLIPLHGCEGAGHVAFSIEQDDIEEWRAFFDQENIDVESKVKWPNGSVSLYFRDPAGNSLELVSPEVWSHN